MKKKSIYLIIILIAVIVLVFFLTRAYITGPGYQQFEVAVEIPEYMLSCNDNSDCILAETLCSSCCGFKGINNEFEQEYYDSVYSEACDGYSAAICDCASATVPTCSNGLCDIK